MEIVLDEQQWDAILCILKEQPYNIGAEIIAEIEDQMEQLQLDELADAVSTLMNEDNED